MYSEQLKPEVARPNVEPATQRTDFYQRRTENVGESERSQMDVNSLSNNVFMKKVYLEGNNMDLTNDNSRYGP